MPRVKSASLTRTEFDQVINRIAELELQIRANTSVRDEAIQKIQNEFTPLETELQSQLKGYVAQAEKYAEEHREELFPNKAKSAQTSLAVFGFRLGNPTLALLNRKWTWEQVGKVLKTLGLIDLIQEKVEPRKDVIKSRAFGESQLAALGMKMTQSETFFIEPKLEGADAVKAEPVSA